MKSLSNRAVRKPAVLVALVVILALLIDFSGLVLRGDHAVADVKLSLIPQDAPQNVAIIAVDEKSLREYGRWPWSRQLHARLLERLRSVGTGPVAFDVLFAEENVHDPAGDQAFANAVASHGKVVLAMASDEDPEDGRVSEVLPFPLLAASAAGIGHTDMAIDDDGIVRGTYLLAGASAARWPGLSLAALYVSGNLRVMELPGENIINRPQRHEEHWDRDNRILFPYAGEPGTFPVHSFVDVLEGRVSNEMLQGKTLFVGVTAAAIRRVFVAPDVSAAAMSGVEIHANIFHALQQQRVVTRVQGLPRTLGLMFLSLLAAWIIVYTPMRGWFSRIALALGISTGLALAIVLTTGLLLPLIPVWLSSMAGSFLSARKYFGSPQERSTRDILAGL